MIFTDRVYNINHTIHLQMLCYFFSFLIHACYVVRLRNYMSSMDDSGFLDDLVLHEQGQGAGGVSRCSKCGPTESDCTMVKKFKCFLCHIVHLLLYGEMLWKDHRLKSFVMQPEIRKRYSYKISSCPCAVYPQLGDVSKIQTIWCENCLMCRMVIWDMHCGWLKDSKAIKGKRLDWLVDSVMNCQFH